MGERGQDPHRPHRAHRDRDAGASGTATVALARLLPVYELGLAQGLSAVGLDPVVLSDDAEVAPFLRAAGGRRGLVLPADQYEVLLPPSTRVAHGVGVIVLLPDGVVERYAEALRAGATGAVAVDASLDEVVDVVVAALHGQTLMPLAVARALARSARGAKAHVRRLRAEEVGWLRGLADSLTVSSLARSTGYSEREMYRLLAALYRRMGAASRTEALLLAQQWGVLDSAEAAEACRAPESATKSEEVAQ